MTKYNTAYIMRDAWNRYREMIKWAGMRFDREKFSLALSLAGKYAKITASPEFIKMDAERENVLPAIDRMAL